MYSRITQFSLMALFILATSTAIFAQPANNECSGAMDISALLDINNLPQTSMLVDNSTATVEATDPSNGFACFGETTASLENTLWFTFTGDGNSYTITSVACSATNLITNNDTQFALYSGACGSLTAVDCNEDRSGAPAGTFPAGLTLETAVGVTYYLMVDGWNGSVGEFCLELSEAPDVITDCDAGMLTNLDLVQVMGPDETFTVEATGVIIPNSPIQGSFAWYFDNGLGGSGGLGGPFWLNVGNTGPTSYNSDLNGVLSGNAFPLMTGIWTVTTRVASDATNTVNTECDLGTETKTIIFDDTPVVTECSAGTLTTIGVINVASGENFTVTATDFIVPNSPTQGGFGFVWDPVLGGTGGFGGGGIWRAPAANGTTTFNSNELVGQGEEELTGTWVIKGVVSSDVSSTNSTFNSFCDFTGDSLIVVFPAQEEITACNAGTLLNTGEIDIAVGETFILEVSNDTVPNTPTDGFFGYRVTPGATGTGGLTNEFIIFNDNPVTWDNDLGGSLSAGDFPPLSGAWTFAPIIFTDLDDRFNSICSTGSGVLTVNFEEEFFPCAAAELLSTETAFVCFDGNLGLAIQSTGDTIPQGGGRGWFFDDSNGGTGGVTGGFVITSSSAFASLNNDLNGVLSTNSLPVLNGPWIVRNAVFRNSNDPSGTVCAVSRDSVLAIYLDDISVSITDNGDGTATAVPSGDPAQYTYEWSGPSAVIGGDTQTGAFTVSGTYEVEVTSLVGDCSATSSVMITTVSTADTPESVEQLVIAPNPTKDFFSVQLDLNEVKEVQLSVLDITGKQIIKLSPRSSLHEVYQLSLKDQPQGMYLVRLRIGDQVTSRRIIKQ